MSTPREPAWLAPTLAFTIAIAALCTCPGCRKGADMRPTDTPQDAGAVDPAQASQPTVAPDPAGGPDKGDSPACILEIEVDKASSYLSEVRSKLGFDLPDWQTEFEALDVDENEHKPLEAASSFTIDGKRLLWWDPDTKRVFVDARHFGKLTAVDAPKLQAGETARIGPFKGHAEGLLQPRSLAEFLIRAGVIQTFWHVEAKLCLREESKGGDGSWRGTFDAEHVYFTNEQNRDAYSFSIEIDPSGAVSATGM
jgi:hypothetical protein